MLLTFTWRRDPEANPSHHHHRQGSARLGSADSADEAPRTWPVSCCGIVVRLADVRAGHVVAGLRSQPTRCLQDPERSPPFGSIARLLSVS